MKLRPLIIALCTVLSASNALATTYLYRVPSKALGGPAYLAGLCSPGQKIFTANGTFTPSTDAPFCTNFRIIGIGGGNAPSISDGVGGSSGVVSYRATTLPASSYIVTVPPAAVGLPASTTASSALNPGGTVSLSPASNPAVSIFSAFGAESGGNPARGSGGGGVGAPGQFGGNGASDGNAGFASPAGTSGPAGQGVSFTASYGLITHVSIISGHGGGGGSARGNGSITPGSGGGGGIFINGAGPSGKSSSPNFAGFGGQGYGGGGASGGYSGGTYYDTGAGAPGVLYIEWDN